MNRSAQTCTIVMASCAFLASPCFGPQGMGVDVDDWTGDRAILCYGICADLNWDNFIDIADLLLVISEYGWTGRLDSWTVGSREWVPRECLDGPFSVDGYVDLYDIMAWDWFLYKQPSQCSMPLVARPNGILSSETIAFERSSPKSPRIASSTDGMSGAPVWSQAGDGLGNLLIVGKRGAGARPRPWEAMLKDRLYAFGGSCTLQQLALPLDRANARLVQDTEGEVYVLNTDVGLLRLQTGEIVIPSGSVVYRKEPRYSLPAVVYLGIQTEGPEYFGRPILDVAFDAHGHAYVVPVVVSPEGGEPYTAAAKLRLSELGHPAYDIIQLYDDPPLPNDNQYRDNLREIEIDQQGHAYVLNTHRFNESDILWKYSPDGATLGHLCLGRPHTDSSVPDPIGMCVSNTSGIVYLASGEYDPEGSHSAVIYGFSTEDLVLERSIRIDGMHHVTSITEDPATGSLWVLGFTMWDILDRPDPLQPFYHPYLAKIPPESDIVRAECLCAADCGDNDLALPISILWDGNRDDGSGTAKTIYVDADAKGANDGTRWVDAYTHLQDALISAQNGDQILVAEGVYKPDRDSANPDGTRRRGASFQLVSGVAMYGGFPNGGSDWSKRDPKAHTTILSGNIGSEASADNSWDVVTVRGTWRTTVLDGFVVSEANVAGIAIFGGSMTIRECTIVDNSAGSGGGIFCGSSYCCLSEIRLDDCNIVNNGVDIQNATVEIVQLVNLESSQWKANEVDLLGEGTLQLDSSSGLSVGNVWVRCNISGPGTIEVDGHSELVIEADSKVNLGDEDTRGWIACDGLLRLTDRAQISNAMINVTRASFERNAIVVNSVITAEAGAPHGQFFIEGTAQVVANDIYADGDRYMDLDPSVFDGVLMNNRIYVAITEGVGQARGGLFELRGQDGLMSTSCESDVLLCQVDPGGIPDFDPTSWTLEELRLEDGAKLNLTNRWDFQPPYDAGGDQEVLYVRNLILGDGAILNTAFNRIYYETLEGDPCSVQNVPLLGFSLNTISFDDADEFSMRVKHNNFEHPDDPASTRIHVERVEGLDPDPSGMMRMSNLLDLTVPEKSPDYPKVVNARAKGTFGAASEDQILVLFEYLFEAADPNVGLVIYVSDTPELLDPCDPRCARHRIEVGRLSAPPTGRPGSAGSGRFGVYHEVVSTGKLDFVRGTRIEFELLGPEGTSILINNWDPGILCTGKCGDVAGELWAVTPVDFLAAVSASGRRSSDIDPITGGTLACLDGFICPDGFVTVEDAMAIDAIDLKNKNLCPPTRPSSKGVRMLAADPPQTPLMVSPAELEGAFIMAGKRYDPCEHDFLSDRLYGLDAQGAFVSGPAGFDSNDRLNTKLVRGHDDQIYQLNLDRGLVRLSDGKQIIWYGRFSTESDPRYSGPATIYVGPEGEVDKWWERPLLDAAFDADGYVYVVPVTVVPEDKGNDPYQVAAKLQPSETGGAPYEVVQLYDDCPRSNDNWYRHNLREIEVDDTNRLYVVNVHSLNESNVLWAYNTDTGALERLLELRYLDNGSTKMRAPVAMHISNTTGTLYLGSLREEPDADSSTIFAISKEDLFRSETGPADFRTITVNALGHITDIAENPATGTLWIVGYRIPTIPDFPDGTLGAPEQAFLEEAPFYLPHLARIGPHSQDHVEADCLSSYTEGSSNFDIALPLSIVWAGQCGAANLSGEGEVNWADYRVLAERWLDSDCTSFGWRGGADLNKSGVVDLTDFTLLGSF